jgi:hypothetical protein
VSAPVSEPGGTGNVRYLLNSNGNRSDRNRPPKLPIAKVPGMVDQPMWCCSTGWRQAIDGLLTGYPLRERPKAASHASSNFPVPARFSRCSAPRESGRHLLWPHPINVSFGDEAMARRIAALGRKAR